MDDLMILEDFIFRNMKPPEPPTTFLLTAEGADSISLYNWAKDIPDEYELIKLSHGPGTKTEIIISIKEASNG